DSAVAAIKLVPSSQLKHQKNSFQHELIPDTEESLKDLYAQKSQTYSYSLSTESSQHSSKHIGFCSGGLQSKCLTSQTKTVPAKSVARQKEGVDRAYPLKPVFHHKGVNVPVVNTAQLGNSPYMEEAPNSRPSSMSKGKRPAGRSWLAAVLSPGTAEPKQSASHLYRRELAYILKLEADGWNLEEQIRKKEALLREKLRRTKEELRRIQREKELVKAEERRDREAERTQEQKAAKHPGETTLRVAVSQGDGGGDFGGVQSAEATLPKPGTTLQPQELAMGKLKKERLVASNSKIRDHVPTKCLASCSELALKGNPSPSALLDQDPGARLSTEVLYLQAASAVKQEGLGQGSFCRPKFLCTRLEKHTSICGKSQGSKRKVVDSSRARARGTDLEKYQQWKSSERPQSKPPRGNSSRQKHEVFIQTPRQDCQVQQILSKGGKVSDPSPLPPIKNSDYITCPYCRCQFAPQAAERHIPKCKPMENRAPAPLQRRQ
ncbi:ZC21C protein, partial [Chordeiles acutipennis]|nr:ZC21C protein [Chordeiles acutipennis]